MSLNLELFNAVDFFDLSEDLLCIIGPDGCFAKVNRAFTKAVGYEEEEFNGKNFTLFLHPDDIAPSEEIMKIIQSGKSVKNFLNRYRHKNGSYIWLSWNGRLIKNSPFIFASARDYTDNKEREDLISKTVNEKEEAVERYNYATLATQDAIWDWDLAINTIYWGGGYKKLFKHPDKEQSVESWTGHIHPEDKKRVITSIYAVINDPSISNWTEEYRYRNHEGEYLYISDHGYVIRDSNGVGLRMVGAMQDVTVLKKSEEELKRLSLIARETSNAVIITDIDGLTTWINDAFTGISGYEIGDMLGKTPGSVLQGEATDRDTIAYMSRQIRDKLPFACEVLNYSRSGQKYWMRVEGQPMVDDTGKTAGFFAIQTDITKEKYNAFEREMLIAELSRNNADLKKFSYITSHNMRAPVANLMAIAGLVDTSKFNDPGTIELFDGFKTSTKHLSETLNDLIDILVIKENTNQQLSEVSFQSTFDTVVQSIRSILTDSEASIRADFTSVPSVLFNGTYLESIFLNLITNSVKYAHPDRRPVVTIQSLIKNGIIQLIYTDNGQGFNLKKVRDRIFGLYQRFHYNSNSKGIGLYLVHSQITSLGGTIDIESEPGKFTRFIITFKN